MKRQSPVKPGSTLSASFTHDENGNTTADGRAGLTFTYNVLNLPETVTSGNTTTATYHWLADGTKYRVEDATPSATEWFFRRKLPFCG